MKQLSLILVSLLFLPWAGWAQTDRFKELRQELIQKQENTRAEIDEINEQISTYEERLVLAEKKYDRLYKQYEDLQNLIALQDQKISTLEEELGHIREEINLTEQEIEKNRERLERLIENYKKTLTYVYKYGRTSQLALIFSSESINQMLVRSFYLNKFEEHRAKQARQIRETKQGLEKTKIQLEDAREKNSSVLDEIRAEKKELAERKERQEKNVALLRRDRRQIENRLAEARLQKEKLDNTLTSLIVEEERVRKAMEAHIRELELERQRKLAAAKAIEDEAERAREIAKYSEPISRDDFLSETALTDIEQSFASRKGDLQWPVEGGTVSEHFGRRRHPVYGTITENIGIEIVTKPKDIVRVVHDGYVTAVYPFIGYGDVVLVSHGKFKTVYGNLSEVMVQKNALLQAGDIIGLSGDQFSAKGESIFFMIREGTENLNPEVWLANK